MLPILNFYGNHNLDFENNDINRLEYYAVSELRNIPIPKEILLTVYNSILKQFNGKDISKLNSVENWPPISFPEVQGVRHFPKENIVSIGPMCYV
jgi:hypothetical protein